jgi:hypothetical protein
MAESDAAGPTPRRKHRWTAAAIAREIKRSSAPLRAAMEQAERSSAPLRAEIDRAAAIAREFLGEEDEGPPPPEPVRATQSHRPTAPLPDPLPPRPAFEADPPKDLLAALREAFPSFKPTDRWWIHVERELKDAHHRSAPESHEAFCAAFRNWSAEDLLRHLEAESRIQPRQRGRKRKRTVDNLDVHQWVMAMATADRSFRHLSQKQAAKLGPFKARTIGTSWAWLQMKADLETEAAENAERAKAELEDRLGEEDHGGFRQSSTKRGIGIQRPTRKDLEHERDVEAFLRSTAGKPRKKRAK